MSAKNALFNGFDFDANGLTITMVDMYSRSRNLQLEGRVIEDGAVQVGDGRLPPKPVTLEGRIRPLATTDLLETAIDNFLLAMNGDKLILDVTHAGGLRRFIASTGNTIISRSGRGSTSAGFSTEFIVPEGFGSNVAPETLLSTTQTAQTQDHAITVNGTYKAQPDIQITVNSVTDGAPMKSIVISNPETTEGITITRAWTAGDVLTLNARDRSVYVNNTRIYTTGAFPSWKPGSRYITVTNDFTARNLGIMVTYTRRWL